MSNNKKRPPYSGTSAHGGSRQVSSSQRESQSRSSAPRRQPTAVPARNAYGTREERERAQAAQRRSRYSQEEARSSSTRSGTSQSRSSSSSTRSSGSYSGRGAQRTPSSRPSGTSVPRTQSTRSSSTSASRSASARPSSASAPHSSSSRTSKTRQTGQAKRPTQSTARQSRRRRKKNFPFGKLLALVVVIVLLAVAVPRVVQALKPDQAENLSGLPQTVSTPLVSDDDKVAFDENISSDSAILISADNGDVLYEKDADTQRAPASLVKMMTVYTAIKHTDNLDTEITMPKEAFTGLDEEGASQSGLKAGEKVTARDLLYAALLSSGGDAANALAINTSGSIEAFVKLMNQEAEKMNLDSTHFVNATGIDSAKQVSTCRDMARMVKASLGNTTFAEVFKSETYTTTANDVHPDGLALTHTMTRDMTRFQRYFDTSGYTIEGGKTGYTTEAGNCLATMAQKDGAPSYIVVTMHATGDGDQYYKAFHDAVTLYGEAYEKLG